MSQTVARCSLCDFPWFQSELDRKGRCQACVTLVIAERLEERQQAIIDALHMVDVLRDQAQTRLNSTRLRHLREGYEAEVSALEDAAHDIATLKDEDAKDYRLLYESANADLEQANASIAEWKDRYENAAVEKACEARLNGAKP